MPTIKPFPAVVPTMRVRRPLDAITGPLAAAARGSQPSKPPYSEGLVLFLSWGPNSAMVRPARHQFLQYCANTWGFTTDSFEVPVVNPSPPLEDKLRTLRDLWAPKDNCLIIVVVYGYFAITDQSGRACWGPYVNSVTNRLLNENFMDWYHVKNFFELGIKADIAYIYDAHFVGQFYAVPAGVESDATQRVDYPRCWVDLLNIGGPYTAKPEILSGMTWGMNQFGIRTGFLTKLINEVFKESKGAPMTIAQLYSGVYHKTLELGYYFLPVHFAQNGRKSITLSRIRTTALPTPVPTPGSFSLPMQYDGLSANDIIRKRITNANRGSSFARGSSIGTTGSVTASPMDDVQPTTPPANLLLAQPVTLVTPKGLPPRPATPPGGFLGQSRQALPVVTRTEDANTGTVGSASMDWSDSSIHGGDDGGALPNSPPAGTSAQKVEEQADNQEAAEGHATASESDKTGSSVEFILERADNADAGTAAQAGPNPATAAQVKGGGTNDLKLQINAVLLDRPDEPVVKHYTQMMLTINVAGYKHKDIVRDSCPDVTKAEIVTAIENLFESWKLSYQLSTEAKLVFVVPQKDRQFIVGVRVPVEVYTLMGLWCGFKFLEIVQEGDGDEVGGLEELE